MSRRRFRVALVGLGLVVSQGCDSPVQPVDLDSFVVVRAGPNDATAGVRMIGYGDSNLAAYGCTGPQDCYEDLWIEVLHYRQ